MSVWRSGWKGDARQPSRLRDLLPGTVFVDVAPTVAALRTVKSAAEIAEIRAMCQLAGDAFDALSDNALDGVELSRSFGALDPPRSRRALDQLTRGATMTVRDGRTGRHWPSNPATPRSDVQSCRTVLTGNGQFP